MKKKVFRIFVDLLVAVGLIIFDQIVKYWVVVDLKGKPPIVLIPGVLELDYLENRGSAFGMFQNQKVFILAISFLFLGALIYLLVKMPLEKKYNVLRLVISVIIAGGIGNMIDRFRLDYVVDFISFVLIHFPVFNLADIYIVCATILLAILILFVYMEEDFQFLSVGKRTGEKE